MTIEEKREAIKKFCVSRTVCHGCPLSEAKSWDNWCYDYGMEGFFDEFYSIIVNTSDTPSQTAKADAGKPKLTLVPQQILYDIAEVREYGCKKYKDPDNWKRVEKERYRDAAFRHFLAYLREPNGVDEESGIAHLKHLACNIAFLCELEKKGE